jgi:hypothetical protein
MPRYVVQRSFPDGLQVPGPGADVEVRPAHPRGGRAKMFTVTKRALAVLATCAAALALLLLPGAASAADSCGEHGVFSLSGATATCTYTTVGQDTFTLPKEVGEIRVVAVGGAGGASGSTPGGRGGKVQGDLSVSEGTTLYVEVGGDGDSSSSGNRSGGYNGGGDGGATPSAGGGGASDIQKCAFNEPTESRLCTSIFEEDRLLVAAGGGGAAGPTIEHVQGAGGNAAMPGENGRGAPDRDEDEREETERIEKEGQEEKEREEKDKEDEGESEAAADVGLRAHSVAHGHRNTPMDSCIPEHGRVVGGTGGGAGSLGAGGGGGLAARIAFTCREGVGGSGGEAEGETGRAGEKGAGSSVIDGQGGEGGGPRENDPIVSGGGGGGGGYWGGGGGGTGLEFAGVIGGGGGGGGGSDLIPEGASPPGITAAAPSVSVSYQLVAPTVGLSVNGNVYGNGDAYELNEYVRTDFECVDDDEAPGISSCTDSNGVSATTEQFGSGRLDTSTPGAYTYTVTGTSLDGETATQSIHYEVLYAPPANTVLPVISGEARDGQTLSITTGSWESLYPPLAFGYIWVRCASPGNECQAVADQGSSYKLRAADSGRFVTVEVGVSDQEGQSTIVEASPVGPVAPAPPPRDLQLPSITGKALNGSTLKAKPGKWASPDTLKYSYQWQRCEGVGDCTNVMGATAASYKLTDADLADEVTVLVDATDETGQSGQAEATPTGHVTQPPPPAHTALPVISGTTRDGGLLKTTSGSWLSPEPLRYSYQWQRCDATGADCVTVAKATHSSFEPTSRDVGAEMTVIVIAADQAQQSTQAIATAVGPVLQPPPPSNISLPVILGAAQKKGELLKLTKGQWESPDKLTYGYRWQRCDASGANCVEIPTATQASYRTTGADVGSDITVSVRATDQEGQTSLALAAPVGPI